MPDLYHKLLYCVRYSIILYVSESKAGKDIQTTTLFMLFNIEVMSSTTIPVVRYIKWHYRHINNNSTVK